MRKKLNILFGLFISFLMMIIPVTVLAEGEPGAQPIVTAVNAVQNNDTGEVDISGTAVDGWNDGVVPALAVTLLVYKEDNTLAAVKHVETSVAGEYQVPGSGDDGLSVNMRNYSTSINLPDGTYLIKAAIYEGGPFQETIITVDTEAEEEDPTEEDPSEEDEPNKKEEKIPEVPEKEQKEKAATSNPETADNIMKIVAIFAIASLGAFTAITVNKKLQKKKAIK